MIATTRAALMRPGGALDALGDESGDLVAVDTPAAQAAAGRDLANFPASIIERSRREFDESSGAWRTVRYYAGRVPTFVPVKAGDRIRDNRDGRLYIVDEAEPVARGLSGRGSVTLTMKRTAP